MEPVTDTTTLQQIEAVLKRLPAKSRKQVLLFVEFLEYLGERYPGSAGSEDTDLWNAVLAHHAYRRQHVGEAAEAYDSKEAFLRATEEP